MKRTTRLGVAWGSAAVVLALVFSMYLRPDMLVSLANQLWNCL